MDYSPSLLGSTRGETWRSSQQIDAVVDVLDLLVGGSVSH